MAADLRIAAQGRRQGRPARGHARRAPRHRRHPAAGAPRRQVAGDRADGHRPAVRLRGGAGARHRRHASSSGRRLHRPGPRLRPPVLPAEQGRARRSAASSARCSRAPRCRSSAALALERELQQQLFQSEDAKEGLAAYVEKRPPRVQGALSARQRHGWPARASSSPRRCARRSASSAARSPRSPRPISAPRRREAAPRARRARPGARRPGDLRPRAGRPAAVRTPRARSAAAPACPSERPAFTVNQACGSGLQAVLSAARAILLGEAEVVLAGGTESHVEHALPAPARPLGLPAGPRRDRRRHVPGRLRRPALRPGHGRDRRGAGRASAASTAPPPTPGPLESQRRCEAARKAGRFAARDRRRSRSPGRKGETAGRRTTSTRATASTLAALAKLAPVFRQRRHGHRRQRLRDHRRRRGDAGRLARRRRASSASRRPPGCSTGRSSASSRGSWASARCRPCASCSSADRRSASTPIDAVELNEAFATPGARLPRRAAVRPRAGQPGRRRDRPRPSDRRHRRAHPRHPAPRPRRAAASKRGIATLCVSGGMGLAALVERAT